MNICCIDLSTELLPPEGIDLRSVKIFTDPQRTSLFRDRIQAGLSGFSSAGAAQPPAIESFKFSLVDLIWQIANGHTERQPRVATDSRSTARSLFIFRQARAYIHDSLQDGVSIVMLCRSVGVSRRALEHIFRSVAGAGPGGYIRALQLNYVRRDLVLPANAGLSIGDIAARRGIWHWSRFATYYRLMFGELPSETRIRHGTGAAAKSHFELTGA